jgi:hypothetical protein
MILRFNDLYCSTGMTAADTDSKMPVFLLAILQLKKVSWEVMLIYVANTQVQRRREQA